MGALAVALAWVGPVLIAVAWLAVRRGASIWVAMGAVAGPIGLLALLTGDLRVGDPGFLAAAGIGLGAGAALFAATAAFMFVVRSWGLLARQAGDVYEMRGALPLWLTLVLAALVVGPGEELLWRGLVQVRLEPHVGEIGAAALAWLAYVAANAFSGSVPIVLGAIVGGLIWGALAVLTGGVVASVFAHLAWTALMIVLPPVFRAAGEAA